MRRLKNKTNLKSALLALLMLAPASGLIAQSTAPGKSHPKPPTDKAKVDPYHLPNRPLDERIKPDKITQLDPPPLPERVIQPMPPVFHLSTNPKETSINPELWHKARAAIDKGLAYLRGVQAPNGAWGSTMRAAPTDQADRPAPVSLAVTGLAVKAFVQADSNALEDPQVRKAIQLLLNARRPDGTFDDSSLANYVTSAVLMGLAAVKDKDFTVQGHMTDAVTWLQTQQWDQSEGLSPRQDWFGGAGYGRHGRPDLSNTQMMLDALHDAGVSPDEPAFQKALAFLSRTQNLKLANPAEWAGNDGGFVYTPANGGESMASEAAGEGRSGEKSAGVAAGDPRSLKSYGSMTYAGFKSMLYAGLSPDDVRVRAAFDWLRHHWTFEENPGLDQQGLYYYYHTLARALVASQQTEIIDAQGVKHNWREELIQAILERQRDDGSWVNSADRWEEGSPELVTVYCVLALEEVLKPTVR